MFLDQIKVDDFVLQLRSGNDVMINVAGCVDFLQE
jgi:hypothetical protein